LIVSQLLPVENITQSAQLNIFVQGLTGSTSIAIDTESNSFDHYPEQLCLIQIGTLREIRLIDTLALKDIAPLKAILADSSIEKIIHGADYDIRCLDRHYGFRVHNIYDTSIAARFAGMTSFGLAALLKDLMGITIDKSKELQRANWGRRPLSAEAIEYAATDVRHLHALRNILNQKLQALGRTAWVAEECARLEELRYNPPNLESAYLSVKGTERLDGKALAIFKSLFMFRDEEARRQRRPPFYVMPDSTLLYLAENPGAPLSSVPGLGQIGLQRFGGALQEALKKGTAAPPVQLPPRERFEHPTYEQTQRLGRLKAWRTSEAASLSLDPSLIWPMASLERLSKAPGTLDAELTSSNVRSWQRERLTPSLRACLKSIG
jgi:ribonuclease D